MEKVKISIGIEGTKQEGGRKPTPTPTVEPKKEKE